MGNKQQTFTAQTTHNGVTYTATSTKSYPDAVRMLQQQIKQKAKQ